MSSEFAPLFVPRTESKVWGTVQHIFSSTHAAVSCLSVNEGYQCSRHYHRYRGNLFNVMEGKILVEVFETLEDRPGNRIHSAILSAGESFAVRALLWHRFQVLESGRVVEVYWNDLGDVYQEDIVRFDAGGAICSRVS